MTEHLWELKLEQIPLGWNDMYQDAIEKYPNGAEMNGSFVHPVDYHAQLLAYFHVYQAKAKSAYDKLQEKFDKKLLNTLVQYDMFLYSVIYEWVDDERDFSQFNSSDLDNQLKDSIYYVVKDDLLHMEPYKQLQLIQMNFDKI
ncbi:hypothetical protein [Psychrobacillus sp.]|uniref:hypothetical protein n=1 Tax=Psychrobacillus sp. TaxID=1871623 RepID=UPI0028BE2DDE|nr:hypothetical protein [Psychrobacillus sp.]